MLYGMKRTLTKQAKEMVGQQVKIAGFVQTVRDQGSLKFLIVRDISGTIQVVVTKSSPEAMKMVESLTLESVIEVVGFVKEEKQAPDGIEIQAEEIKVLSLSDPELPIPVVEKGREETDQHIRLDWRWIDLRKPPKALIFKVWTFMEQAFREYWIQNGYIEIHSLNL